MGLGLAVGVAASALLVGVGGVAAAAADPPPTITFAPLANKTFGDPDFAVSATSSDGGTVSFGAGGSCTVSGSTVHLTGAGSCTITASEGAATPVARSFTIAKSSQTITFAAIPNKSIVAPDFVLHATASSGLAVSYASGGNCTVSGATVHIRAAGPCTVVASQAGNENYDAAVPVSRRFAVLGPTPCKLPRLRGRTLAAAKGAIARSGCSVGNVTYTYSPRRKGTVVSQSHSGTVIDFVVSSGPVPRALAEAVVSDRCSRTTARVLLARLRLGDLGDPRLRDPVGQVVCGAFAGKASRAMAVTLAIPACGRTEGWVVFRWNGRTWKLVLRRTNGAALAASGTAIRETVRVVRSGGTGCDPSGGSRSRLWRWNGGGLAAGPWKRTR